MFFETNGMKLYYETAGTGRPLLLLHGNGEDHRIFSGTAEKLKDRFTVYLPDTRGHGQSSPVKEYHYEDMAKDAYELITGLKLDRPILCGFSDGGIVGLILAARHPSLLSALVACGANTNPAGLTGSFRFLIRLNYAFTRSPLLKLMLREPHISPEMLRTISVPTYLTYGSRDIAPRRHAEKIRDGIPGSVLKIFSGESHASYVEKNDKLADYLLELF